MQPVRTTLLMGALAALAGGAAQALPLSSVEEIMDEGYYGADFHHRLARQYRAFASTEAYDMYDWVDADYFAEKAQLAARGETVLPVDPAEWNLEPEARAEALAARRALMRALDGGAREAVPRPAARAQAFYDCWVEQLEEGWQLRDIAFCRTEFENAMVAIDADMTAAEQASRRARLASETWTVYFGFDEASLRPAGQRTLAEAARALRPLEDIRIEIVGHADRAGPRDYNHALSERRADAVRAALLGAEIPQDRIAQVRIEAEGETEPAVETGDGVALQANRRVVIRLAGADLS